MDDRRDYSDFFSHTPPNFTPSSYEVKGPKRCRSGSVSGRIRSASDAEERGLIDRAQRDALKDLVILGDPALSSALDKFAEGEVSDLENLIKCGVLDEHPHLDQIVDNLDSAFFNMPGVSVEGDGTSTTGNHPQVDRQVIYREGSFDFNDIYFENGDFLSEDRNISNDTFLAGRVEPIPEDAAVAGGSYGLPLQQAQEPPQRIYVGQGPENSLEGGGLETSLSWCSTGSLDLGHGLDDFGMSPSEAESTMAAVQPASKSGVTTVVQANGKCRAFEGKVTFPAKMLETRLNASVLQSTSIDIPKPRDSVGGGRPMMPQKVMAPPPPVQLKGAQGVGQSKSPLSDDGMSSAVGPVAKDSTARVWSHLEYSVDDERSAYSDSEAVVIEQESKHMIGAYSPESRKARIERFLEKKKKRIWHRKVKYDVRKNFADSRIRVKGRFVKKEDEAILYEMSGLGGEAAPPQKPPVQPKGETRSAFDDDDLLALDALFPDPDYVTPTTTPPGVPGATHMPAGQHDSYSPYPAAAPPMGHFMDPFHAPAMVNSTPSMKVVGIPLAAPGPYSTMPSAPPVQPSQPMTVPHHLTNTRPQPPPIL